MSEALTLFDFDEPKRAEFPPDWPYHGRPSGHRYGCRCTACVEAHSAANKTSAARAGSPRVCKRCGEPYVHVMNSGTGVKYCAGCKAAAYEEALRRHVPNLSKKRPCDSCGADVRERRGRRWHLCSACGPAAMFVTALSAHRAETGFVMAVAARPQCWACGADLQMKVKDRKGRLRYRFALDHDHTCCPGNRSCGRCLRGLLCTDCNTALGFLRDSAERARSLADYLAAVSEVSPDAVQEVWTTPATAGGTGP